MKTTRVVSLLFSLCQFLLFLKFIEMVRGEPISLSDSTTNGSSNSREQRHFFVAPRVKERKFKPWLSSTSTPNPKNSTQEEDLYIGEDGSISYNRTEYNGTALSDRDGLTEGSLSNNTSSESSSGRLCPGCEGGTCGAATLSSYRFPGIPLLIALAVGVAWFFVFLFLFYFLIDPPKAKPVGYHPSSGYGYSGASVGHDGWAQSQSSSLGGSGGISSLLNLFTGDQRSLNHVNSLTDYVLNALATYTKTYMEST